MYTLEQVTTPSDLSELLKIAGKSTYHEYDCDRDTYLNHIVKHLYGNTSYRMMLLKYSGETVGYFISSYNNFLYNELWIMDVYIDKAHQGKSCIQLFLADIRDIGFKVGAKRVKWHSYIFGSEFWSKHTLGFPVKSYEVFYVDLEEIEE